MGFKDIVKHQQSHQALHKAKTIKPYESDVHSCIQCYLVRKDKISLQFE